MNYRHLFLTSAGLSDEMITLFLDIIGKSPKDIKILYIPTAGIETDGGREGFAVCLNELIKMGIIYENILIYNLELILSKEYKRTYSSYIDNIPMISRLLSIDELRTIDAIFVSGGDSAVLCREMVRTGVNEMLVQAIDDGVVYVGISAGSMYAAGNLDNGLHIISNPVIPHCEKDNVTENKIELSDGHAVYVENDIIRWI